MREINYCETIALSYIPPGISEAVKRTMGLYKGNISEIRLRADKPVFITVNNKNISCNISATSDELHRIVRSLCGNSMYSHSETIKEGYICSEGGLRTGVCGRAVTEQNRIISVTDITSVCIRIPHRVIGASDELVKLLIADSGGLLVFSKPGVGKTTVLRELSARLSSAPFFFRVAVVDTRFEICGALNGNYTIDALCGYPRAKGIETALRTLSPQFIVCDEIANREDSEAVLSAAGAGVPVIASAHAGSFEELKKNRYISPLVESGIFRYTVELSRENGKLKTTVVRRGGEKTIC